MTLMRKTPPVDYPFQEKSKFALLTLNNVYTDLPAETCQLPNGTWTMPGLPVPDLGIWKEWLGSIRLERLGGANLGLFVEEPSDNPRSLDNAHQRLTKDLSWLFHMLHLRAGIETDSADLLCGSSVNGVPEIRQMSQMPTFYQSTGYTRAPITRSWIEDGLLLREGAAAMEADKKQFRRVIRGLKYTVQGPKRNRPGSSSPVCPVVGGPRPSENRQHQRSFRTPLPNLCARVRRHARPLVGSLRDAERHRTPEPMG